MVKDASNGESVALRHLVFSDISVTSMNTKNCCSFTKGE